jgi:non-heme chloroperoxidase
LTTTKTVTSRREILIGGAGMVATASLSAVTGAAVAQPANGSTGSDASKGKLTMNTITTKDGTQSYYKDWGKGPVVTFSHGWPLSSGTRNNSRIRSITTPRS